MFRRFPRNFKELFLKIKMTAYPGKISLYCFVSALFSLFFLLLYFLGPLFLDRNYIPDVIILITSYFALLFVVTRLFLKDFLYKVGVRALFLGGAFSCGICVAVLAPNSYKVFGCYMSVLSFFHFSEFVAIAVSNPETLSLDSFILDHSPDYKIALIVSWIEYFVERYFYPDLKTCWWVALAGLSLCIGGEALRKVAMLTASSNFSHTVQVEKKSGHELVTTGVYSWTRHPSYLGWFYWAIGTQVLLLNPLCTVAYTLASWKFFSDRITIEEVTLLSFFGQEYVEYQKRVPTRLPFIKGYLLQD